MANIKSGIERWYWNKIIECSMHAPKINSKAKYVLLCLLANVTLCITLVIKHEEFIIYIILLTVILPTFFLYMIYLYLKFGVVVSRMGACYSKENDRFDYYFSFFEPVIGYLVTSTISIWIIKVCEH